MIRRKLRALSFSDDIHRRTLQSNYAKTRTQAVTKAFDASWKDKERNEVVCTDLIFMNGYTMPFFTEGEVLLNSKCTGSCQ